MKNKTKVPVQVPVLTGEPEINQARAYLIWLAGSKFQYHIDDDVSTVIFSFPVTEEDLQQLIDNYDFCFGAFSGTYGNDWNGEMWNVYGLASDMAELLNEGFPDLSEERTEEKLGTIGEMASKFNYANA